MSDDRRHDEWDTFFFSDIVSGEEGLRRIWEENSSELKGIGSNLQKHQHGSPLPVWQTGRKYFDILDRKGEGGLVGCFRVVLF